MIKKYWTHEPVNGLIETYNSDSWLEVMIGWFLAKTLACIIIGIVVGIIFIIVKW